MDEINNIPVENEYFRYLEAIESRKKKPSKDYYEFIRHTSKNIIQCSDIPSRMLIMLLDHCPIGEGLIYEHFVLDSIGKILAGVVDREDVLMHVQSEGGYHDIEFAFCTEAIADPKYSFWEAWYHRYDIESIIVEAKNEKKKVGIAAAQQVYDYVKSAKKGRLGTLVSRNGFTINALKKLRSYADDDNILILPINHEELKTLLNLSTKSALSVFQFLRIKENRLRRVNKHS